MQPIKKKTIKLIVKTIKLEGSSYLDNFLGKKMELTIQEKTTMIVNAIKSLEAQKYQSHLDSMINAENNEVQKMESTRRQKITLGIAELLKELESVNRHERILSESLEEANNVSCP